MTCQLTCRHAYAQHEPQRKTNMTRMNVVCCYDKIELIQETMQTLAKDSLIRVGRHCRDPAGPGSPAARAAGACAGGRTIFVLGAIIAAAARERFQLRAALGGAVARRCIAARAQLEACCGGAAIVRPHDLRSPALPRIRSVGCSPMQAATLLRPQPDWKSNRCTGTYCP